MSGSAEPNGPCALAHSTDDRKIRVTVQHLDAEIVADELREWMKLEYPQTSLETTREGVADSIEALKRYQKWLKRLNWGAPEGDVELTMPYRDARSLTERLLATGGDGAIDDADTRTRAVQALTAGDHLAKQVSLRSATERDLTADACREIAELTRSVAETLGPDNDHVPAFIGWAERLELQDAALRGGER